MNPKRDGLLLLGVIAWLAGYPASALAQISVDIEPRSAQFGLGAPVVHYERVAPAIGGQVQGRVCLRVAITNTGSPLQLDKVTVAVGGKNYEFGIKPPGFSVPTVSAGATSALWFNNIDGASPCPLIALP